MKKKLCAGIVACSEPLGIEKRSQIGELCEVLARMGIGTVCSPFMYTDGNAMPFSAGERARVLMDYYSDASVDMIFDVSGGDLANEILDYLDYDLIKENQKPFWGYSDLTCILNAIYRKTGNSGVLYQVRNLVKTDGTVQQERFKKSLMSSCEGVAHLYDFEYEFLQGRSVEGVVVGGNMRCFLKLAGTEYMPDLTGSILVLEAYGGGVPQMVNYVSHLRQMGAFEKVSGILLGTCTFMEMDKLQPTMAQILLENVPSTLPVLRTGKIGHGADSAALKIGEFRTFKTQ